MARQLPFNMGCERASHSSRKSLKTDLNWKSHVAFHRVLCGRRGLLGGRFSHDLCSALLKWRLQPEWVRQRIQSWVRGRKRRLQRRLRLQLWRRLQQWVQQQLQQRVWLLSAAIQLRSVVLQRSVLFEPRILQLLLQLLVWGEWWPLRLPACHSAAAPQSPRLHARTF